MTALPQTEKLSLALFEEWLTISLNSPENRNALGTQMSQELSAVLGAVEDDRSIRGITLRGAGNVFCAGGDLKEFSALLAAPDPDTIAKMNLKGGALFAQLQAMPQVVIALVDGAAIAGGLGLMCCADFVIVTKDAKFALTETRLGIVPAQIAPLIAARAGLPAARRLMLTGAQFDGAFAQKLGLADIVVDSAADFEAEEERIKAGVRLCAPGANGLTKAVLLASAHLSGEALAKFAAQSFARAMTSPEGQEGVKSFAQKRSPYWARADKS